MTHDLQLAGKLVPGAGQAAYFTQLDWVQQQCAEKLGFIPYPGTLNVQVFDQHLAAMAGLQGLPGISLVPPTDDFCRAKTLPVTVEGIRGALIVPQETVRVHGESIVEIMSPIGLKDALGLKDGDALEFTVHEI